MSRILILLIFLGPAAFATDACNWNLSVLPQVRAIAQAFGGRPEINIERLISAFESGNRIEVLISGDHAYEGEILSIDAEDRRVVYTVSTPDKGVVQGEFNQAIIDRRKDPFIKIQPDLRDTPFSSETERERFLDLMKPKDQKSMLDWEGELRFNRDPRNTARQKLFELRLDRNGDEDFSDGNWFGSGYGEKVVEDLKLDELAWEIQGREHGTYYFNEAFPVIDVREIQIRQEIVKELMSGGEKTKALRRRIQQSRYQQYGLGLSNVEKDAEFIRDLPAELREKVESIRFPAGPVTSESIRDFRQALEAARISEQEFEHRTQLLGNRFSRTEQPYGYNFLRSLDVLVDAVPAVNQLMKGLSSLRARQLQWRLEAGLNPEFKQAQLFFHNGNAAALKYREFLARLGGLNLIQIVELLEDFPSEVQQALQDPIVELEYSLRVAERAVEHGWSEFAEVEAPESVGGASVILKNAQNPVMHLKGSPVIPIDLQLGPLSRDGAPHKILTGDNNGGKSTSLKTMVQALYLTSQGSPGPWGPGTRITPSYFFYYVHPRNASAEGAGLLKSEVTTLERIRRLVADRPNSFVLLDEIVKGSWPQVNEVIERAFLKEMVRLKATVIATTHNLSHSAGGESSLTTGSIKGTPDLANELGDVFKNVHVENFTIQDGPARSLNGIYAAAREVLIEAGWPEELVRSVDEEWKKKFPESVIH